MFQLVQHRYLLMLSSVQPMQSAIRETEPENALLVFAKRSHLTPRDCLAIHG
jgi:hypothetical protein